MRVTNVTGETIIAFGFHQYGYGNDVWIEPGETKEVSGPFIGEMGGGNCYVTLEGNIICHSDPDDDGAFQVIQGKSLSLQAEDRGVIVRHYLDEPEASVKEWRRTVVCTPSATEPSYCLDVIIGYDDSGFEGLISFIKSIVEPFEIGQLERCLFQGMKILRIKTPMASRLKYYICDNLPLSDGYEYIVRGTYIAAPCSSIWLPDPDSDYGRELLGFV